MTAREAWTQVGYAVAAVIAGIVIVAMALGLGGGIFS